MRPARVLALVLLSYPVWWVLGLAYFMWPVLTFPLLLSLLRSRSLRYPRGFSLWLVFLGWMVLSVTQVTPAHRLIAFAYRGVNYVSVSVIFLYVYNLPGGRRATQAIVDVLTAFWCLVVIGGFAGLLFPTVGFSTPAESLMPQSLLSDQTILYFVHPFFTEVSHYFGYTSYRPKVLFAYTNQWGGCLALLTPFVFASLARHKRPLLRWFLIGLLGLSLIPLVMSLDRGAWIGLSAGMLYAVGRLLVRAPRGRRMVVAMVVVFGAAVVVVSPLGSLLQSRLTSAQNSNATRANVYAQVLTDTLKSPLLGYGSPRPDPTAHVTNPNLPHVGTQGQYPLVMFSNGFPGICAFIGWFLVVVLRTRRIRMGPGFWANVSLLVAIVEMPYYDFVGVSFHIVMIAAAVALRSVRDQVPATQDGNAGGLGWNPGRALETAARP